MIKTSVIRLITKLLFTWEPVNANTYYNFLLTFSKNKKTNTRLRTNTNTVTNNPSLEGNIYKWICSLAWEIQIYYDFDFSILSIAIFKWCWRSLLVGVKTSSFHTESAFVNILGSAYSSYMESALSLISVNASKHLICSRSTNRLLLPSFHPINWNLIKKST